MSVRPLRRRSVHIFIAVIAALSAIVGASSSALASGSAARQQRLEIVRPYRTDVSGTIFFAARGIKPRAVRIVFRSTAVVSGAPGASPPACTAPPRSILASFVTAATS